MDTQTTPPTVPQGSGLGKFGLIYIFAALALIAVGASFWIAGRQSNPAPLDTATTPTEKYTKKRIVYVDSYHEGYEWSDGITAGIRKVLKGTGVELRIIRMDTKNNTSEDFKLAAAVRARDEIDAYRPDVLIASDDNAFKYLIKEYYKDAKLPVVFCGLNWDASVYGAPYINTTGMVEVSLTTQILDQLRPFAKGPRLGYLSADTETERKNLTYYEKLFGLQFAKIYFVKDMASWKSAFAALQIETDLIIFENNAGISDWNDQEAEDFTKANISVPVGTTNPWTMKESVLGITKIPDEQGEWSARAALQILDGVLPRDIPLAKNEKGTLIVNLGLAEKLNIVFPPNILKNAQVTE
jgi:ABC-type uncharacterized transport system substrate-binding protein